MSDTVKFPHIVVPLVGKDGNAFAILGRVITAMRRGGCTEEEIDAFKTEATSGDYSHLLNTVMKTVSEASEDDDDDDSFNGISDADEEEDIIEDDLDSKEAESVVEEVEDEEDEDDDEDEA